MEDAAENVETEQQAQDEASENAEGGTTEAAAEEKEITEFTCEICSEDIKSMREAEGHLNGKSHKRKLELQFITKCVKKEKCELCGTTYDSLNQVIDHLNGYEHATNIVHTRTPSRNYLDRVAAGLAADHGPKQRGGFRGRGGSANPRGRGGSASNPQFRGRGGSARGSRGGLGTPSRGRSQNQRGRGGANPRGIGASRGARGRGSSANGRPKPLINGATRGRGARGAPRGRAPPRSNWGGGSMFSRGRGGGGGGKMLTSLLRPARPAPYGPPPGMGGPFMEPEIEPLGASQYGSLLDSYNDDFDDSMEYNDFGEPADYGGNFGNSMLLGGDFVDDYWQ